MTTSTILLVAGARPNFMKVAPIARAARACPEIDVKLVHTGQHYDHAMSAAFFAELDVPEPAVVLAAGSGTHAEQTARIMVAFESVCLDYRPDLVVVVGDVNSTLACTLAAKKLGIPVAHVEAGLRCGDLTMPEEINRVMTDAVADWYFVSEPSGVENLKREGKPDSRVFHVGNVMVDNLLYQTARLGAWNTREIATIKDWARASTGRYGVVTLHRPSNVDDPVVLGRICRALDEIAFQIPLVFVVHPRTRAHLERNHVTLGSGVTLIGPQSFMPFLSLWVDAAVVLTDSGGLQDETTALGVPCVTLRDTTERPITVSEGTNVIAGTDPVRIVEEAGRALTHGRVRRARPHLWDGKTAERIVDILSQTALREAHAHRARQQSTTVSLPASKVS